jgi:5,10-methylene-tetrahydrofolate dehydrogenase/methenyl tetrahydrofolate cyclohydrolase
MPDIPPGKLMAWQAIAAEMDARFHHATSAMREQLGSVPKIVEVAYTNSEFPEIYEEFFEEATDVARATGVAYEIDKLYLKDGEAAAARHLRDRLSALSSDPSVDGIRLHASYLGGRELPHDLNWIDPLKDIDCATETSDRWARRGRGWLVKRPAPFIHPRAGSVLKVLSYGLKKTPLTDVSVALLKARSDYSSYDLTLLAAVLRCRSVITCIDPSLKNAGRIRQADAIVTQVDKPRYLDERYLRQGQIVIDLGMYSKLIGKGDLDLEGTMSAIPLIEAYANMETVSNLHLRISFLNAIRSFLIKQNKEIANRFMPMVELV